LGLQVHNPCEPEDSEAPTSPGREPNMLEYYANLAGQMDIGKILHTARSVRLHCPHATVALLFFLFLFPL